MSDWIIITSADSKYVELADGLISSIRTMPGGISVPIGVLDAGLEPEQRQHFIKSGIKVCEPEWCYDISDHRQPPQRFMKALMALPFLPQYFPGYGRYLYIDSDAWIQDWAALALYLKSANEIGFAITPELDRSYPALNVDWNFRVMRRFFDKATAQNLMFFPTLNDGVFCGRADAPHWDLWADILGEIYRYHRATDFFSVQSALNAVIRLKNPPTALLPAWCNWVCHATLSMCSDDGKVLHEPQPPYRRLGVVHLTGDRKHGVWELKGPRNITHKRSLRFDGKVLALEGEIPQKAFVKAQS